jgi:hypothetical protein
MLQITKSNSPEHKNNLIRELLSSEKTTLIVSDLESKLYWQSLTKNKVLRASEFWKILIKKIEPNLHLFNDQATLIQLQKAIDEIPDSIYADLKFKKIKPTTFMKFFFELFPLFNHPNTAEIMQYWFDEQKQSSPTSWEPIYYLCKGIWTDLKKENILPERLISSYLLNALNYEYQWKSPLVFDLGGNLQTTESELILTLSQQLNVTVIEPKPDWIEDFHWLAWPYQQLKTRSFQDLPYKPLPYNKNSTEEKFYRFTNPLSEIKMAITQIKQWIKEGVPKSQIYITAPNIEEYWPALKWHLENESLAYNRDPKLKLLEILSLKKLISKLKCTFLRSIDKGDLEAALFINEATPPLKYSDFSQLYSELFSPRDYFRHPKVSEKFNPKTIEKELSADEFLQILNDFYPVTEDATPLLEEIKTKLLSSTPAQFKVAIHYWIYYLENLLQKVEVSTNEQEVTEIEVESKTDDLTIEDFLNSNSFESVEKDPFTIKPARETINIVPLPSIYALSDFKAIFLGLSEASLKSTSSVISGRDVMSLLNKTGHLLDHPERNYFEFLLRWSLSNKNGHIYSFAETNWQTEELTPSVFWLLGYTQFQSDINNVVGVDLAERNLTSALPNKITLESGNESTTTLQANGINRSKPEFKKINTVNIFKSLSPSGLEKLNDCAFKYYVERLLNLNEERILDLDPSPMTLGSLYHKLCELLTVEPVQFSLTDSEWNNISERTLKSANSFELLDFQKTEIKNKLIEWGKSFLIYEKEWRQNHPDSRVFGRELKFSGSIGDIKLNGKIDRMDWDQLNQFSIVDYKSSVSHLSGPLSWIKNNQLQLLCYVYAAKKGWIENLEYPNISGAYYLSLKTFDKKGFTSTDSKPTFLSPLSSKSELNNEAIDELLIEFEAILNQSIEKLKSGNIDPIPRDEKICTECSWRHLCRAPHLNM